MIVWEQRQSQRSASRHSHKRSHTDLVAERNSAFIPGAVRAISHIAAVRVGKRHFHGHARRTRRMGDRPHSECREQDNHKNADVPTHRRIGNVLSNLCLGPVCRRYPPPWACPPRSRRVWIGHALLDRDCRGLNAVRALQGQDLGCDKLTARAVGNHLNQLADIMSRTRAAR